jgi:endonuclease/exonuclease/phosphatase family metal-dependent hydrolase
MFLIMVKLICYNIEYCEGLNGKWYQYLEFWKTFFPPKNLDKNIVDELNKIKPDILALIEIDNGSFRSKKDEGLFFKKNMNMKDLIEEIKYPRKGWLKLFHYVPILKNQGNAILSKYPIIESKCHLLNEGTKRVVIEARVKCPKKITLLVSHLALGKKTREKQIWQLIHIVKNIKGPVILMGDFNTFNGEEEISALLKETHLKDRNLMESFSRILTQPTCSPKRRLDYILYSKEIKVKKYSVLNFPYSDHLPLFVDFEIS